MPGRRVTPEQYERFTRLVTGRPPWTIARAAGKVGISPATGYRLARGLHGGENPKDLAEKLSSELPAPMSFEELDPVGKEMLRDFGVFSEKALCRHASPWRVKAAELSVQMFLDKTQKHYTVANEPPSVGKSTLWTLDIPLWLVSGGGVCDPGWGRAMRFMLGHQAKNVSIHYVQRMQRILDLKRPYYDKEQQRYAEVCLGRMFGRFKPDLGLGDATTLWTKDQFIVAQGQDVDLYEKEPTVQAASRQAGFIGERCDYIAWDDLVTDRNSFNPEIIAKDEQWME